MLHSAGCSMCGTEVRNKTTITTKSLMKVTNHTQKTQMLVTASKQTLIQVETVTFQFPVPYFG